MFSAVRVAFAAVVALASLPVSAAALIPASVTYNFTISSADWNGSGSLVASGFGQANEYPCATCVTGPGRTVTSITGVINGATITGVAPLASVAGNNNRIYATAPYLDWGDLGIATADHLFNVFNGDYHGNPGDYLAIDNQPIFAHPVSFTLEVAPVPEPAVWAMMSTGLIGLTLTARRRKALRP